MGTFVMNRFITTLLAVSLLPSVVIAEPFLIARDSNSGMEIFALPDEENWCHKEVRLRFVPSDPSNYDFKTAGILTRKLGKLFKHECPKSEIFWVTAINKHNGLVLSHGYAKAPKWILQNTQPNNQQLASNDSKVAELEKELADKNRRLGEVENKLNSIEKKLQTIKSASTSSSPISSESDQSLSELPSKGEWSGQFSDQSYKLMIGSGKVTILNEQGASPIKGDVMEVLYSMSETKAMKHTGAVTSVLYCSDCQKHRLPLYWWPVK